MLLALGLGVLEDVGHLLFIRGVRLGHHVAQHEHRRRTLDVELR